MITQIELDAQDVSILKLPDKLQEYLKARDVETVGDLRKMYPKLEANPPTGVGYGKVVRRKLATRFSTQIYCTKCGGAMVLYRSTKSCPEGCGGVVAIGRGTDLHRAFPDMICESRVDRAYG